MGAEAHRGGRTLASGLAWTVGAGALGFAASGVLTGLLHWPRERFVLGYAVLVGGFLVLWITSTRPNLQTQFARRWPAGVMVGLLLGILLVFTVTRQPASGRPVGLGLVRALVWDGAVYGAVDAILFTIVPVIEIYGSRPARLLERPAPRLAWGGAALVASLAITAAYHLGFAEFRGAALLQPLIGNALITAGYLMAGNPWAPVTAHVMLHGAAVLHGMATAAQLPPHY